MTKQEVSKLIEQDVISKCKENNLSIPDKLEYSESLSVYGVDSIILIDLIVAIENRFMFEIDDEDLVSGAFDNISGISDYVLRKCACGEKS